MTINEVSARKLLDQWSLDQAERLARREAGILNADQSVVYLGNMSANSYRGPSPVIWAGTQPNGSPTPGNWIASFIQDPSLGMHFFDDFLCTGYASEAIVGGAVSGDVGNWAIYLGSAGQTIADAGIIGGGLQMVGASIAVASGASTPTVALNSFIGAFQLITNSSGASALQGKLAFEARVMLTSVTASKRDAFVGLCDQLTPGSNLPFTAAAGGSSNLLTSTRNLIGFYNPSSGGGQDWEFVYQLASTAAVFPTNLNSLVSTVTGSSIVAGTWYKLGFIFDAFAPSTPIGTASTGQTAGTLAKQMLKVYVNGQQAPAYLTQTNNILTASFPTGIMGPVAAFCNAVSGTSNTGTASAGTFNIDWLRVAQAAEA